MKLYKRHLGVLFILLATLSSCDFETFIDENFKEKSLVVLSPNFIKNTVTLVFENADTGEIIDEDLEVNMLSSSKKIIDLSGNIKNNFNVKNGLLNFAVDPNEEINENSPLYFRVLINDRLSNQSFFKVSSNNTLIRIPVINMPSVNLDPGANKTSDRNDNEMPITLNIDGKTIDEFKNETKDYFFEYKILNSSSSSLGGYVNNVNKDILKYFSINNINPEFVNYFFNYDHFYTFYDNILNATHFRQLLYSGYNENKRYEDSQYLLDQPQLKKPTTISVELNPGYSWDNVNDYYLNIKFVNHRNQLFYYTISNNGFYEQLYRPTIFTSPTIFTGDLVNEYDVLAWNYIRPWNDEITIPDGNRIIHVELATMTNDETQQCMEGFNLNFEMMGVNEDDRPNLLYKTERNSGKTSHIGYASLTKGNSSHNTASFSNGHSYGKLSNKIIFEDNLQYDIIPNTMELGGVEACGKTYNFKVVAKDYLEKYKMNIQFQCSGDEFSTAPTLVAFFNEANTPDKVDMINLNNGSTSLYLKPEGKYEILGVFNESKFRMSFTNNQSEIEQAIRESIDQNENIQNIEYSLSIIEGEKVINAKILFKEGFCPE